MKKLLVSICTAFLIVSASLSAFEWGGVLKDETGITTPDFKAITFNQSNSIVLWAKTPLGKDSGFSFSTEALYKYNLAVTKDSTTFDNIVDLTLFKVAGALTAGEGDLSIDAGRFYTADSTGAVIAQICDGLNVSYALSRVQFGLFAGYTGLINSLDVTSAVAPEKDNKVYNLAYPYVPLGLKVLLPALFLNQNLTLEGYALFDCGSNKTNLYYANLVFAGPFTNIIYYNLSTSFGSADFKNLMNYSAFTLYVFPTDTISVTGGLDFGTGDKDKVGAYNAISSKVADVSARIVPRAGFTYGTDNLCLDLTGKFILGYADEKYSAAGTELDVNFVYNIFSDLQVGLEAKAFFDATESKANDYTVKLNVALAF
ncbi:MAG: hypothetical protein IK102_10365 [Treponema sp.]|nr:hypothetical protein [Treponema sp.]